MQRQPVDASAHVHRRSGQPDRLRGNFHHSARIISASQLADTSRGNVNVQPCALRKLIAPDPPAAATCTGTNRGDGGNDAKRRDQ
jgi:hypothetical protein